MLVVGVARLPAVSAAIDSTAAGIEALIQADIQQVVALDPANGDLKRVGVGYIGRALAEDARVINALVGF